MRGSGPVWHALAKARRANLAAAGEAAPRAGSGGLTRRALLQGLAASGVAAAVRPQPAAAFTGGRVAIVGGGIAGLSALHHLRAAGVDAQLYEARGRLGGRMFTHRPANGAAFEIGGQLVNSDHADMRALAAELGIALIDRKAAPHRTAVIADGQARSEAEIVAALRPIAAQIGRDADALDADWDAASRPLDRLSMAQYLDAHAALLPDAWVRRLLEGTSRTEYGVEPNRASALELIFSLPTVKGERFDVLGGSDERWVVEGGTSTVVDALAARHASCITTGKRLLRVAPAGRRLRLDFLDGSHAEADRLIVAVPASIARQIDFAVPLPAAWRGFLAEMDLGRNEKIQALATAPVWAEGIGRGGELWQTDAAAGHPLAWDGSVRIPGREDFVWTWFLGGDAAVQSGTAAELAARFAAAAEPAIPGIAAATAQGPVRRTRWGDDPLTLGGYVNYAPGQLTRFGGLLWVESDGTTARQEAVAGRIAFAGEHLSDAWPGYMNGGAETGRFAAEALTGRRTRAQAA